MEAVTPKERCGVTCLEYIDGLEYSHLTKRMSPKQAPQFLVSFPLGSGELGTQDYSYTLGRTLAHISVKFFIHCHN